MSDLLCYGSICADLYIWLPHWPQPGSGLHALNSRWVAGGNALNEARALVSLGAQPLLYGDRLGYDPAGDLIAAELTTLGLMTHIERRADVATPVCHILITPDGERTIIALRRQTAATPPQPDQLAMSQIVSVSRYGLHTADVALLARRLNRFVVAGDVAEPTDPLAQAADVIVTSADLLGADPLHQATVLQHVRGAPIFLTAGSQPARVLVSGKWYEVTPASSVVTNTTGAGDVFRAGVVYGIWQGWDWEAILAFATRVATAFVASRHDETA
ncbi:MAG: carbohydrate kinase family protein [Chloroflexus sp.]|nr:carbohydrate kinase family protein [Chloroflexus sp.]